MFGSLRFVLAILVALSHMKNFSVFNLGVTAVVIFYLLSGYVMTYSFTVNFKNKLNNVGKFYLDRALRIYPILLFYFIIVSSFVLITNFRSPHFTFTNVIADLTIIPLNFFMYTNIGSVLIDPPSSILPSTWSLGAEIQFYLIIPFLIFYKKMNYIVFVGSLIFFIIASFGLVNTDNFGYRLLPGILFIFLTGSLLYKIKTSENAKIERYFVKITFILMILLVLVLTYTLKIRAVYTIEVVFGYLLGILLIFVLSSVTSDKESKKVDEILGDLSYPVFLSHYLTIFIMNYTIAKYHPNLDPRDIMLMQILMTLTLSGIGYLLIEKPSKRLRKYIRESKKAKLLKNDNNISA